MKLRLLLLILLLCICLPLYSGTIFLQEIGHTELELEFDLYYMPLGWYIPLTLEPIPKIDIKEEENIYKHLLSKIFSIRFVVLELSTYPMPLLGIFTRKYTPDFYHSAKVSEDVNIIESITTSGFQEPWAASLFIGNVIKFNRVATNKKAAFLNKKNLDYDGKGYSGFLFTYGNYHIKQNELIKDHWIESEVKIKGQKANNDQEIYLNYKIGTKYHFNTDIKSSAYLGFERDRIDYNFYRFSLLRNSSFQCRLDFDLKRWNLIKFLLLYGKKFPLRKTRLIIPELSIGVLWNVDDPYRGELADPEGRQNIAFIIRPNVRF